MARNSRCEAGSVLCVCGRPVMKETSEGLGKTATKKDEVKDFTAHYEILVVVYWET